MAIDQNMKEVLKFNRSYMAKTHYSKSDLEQIAVSTKCVNDLILSLKCGICIIRALR